MDDWEYIESRFETLDNQLEYAKKHPFKVALDFDTRFRVWKDQVLKDRLLMLEKTRLIDNAIRYYNLSGKDYVRLFERATKEFLEVADNRMTPGAILNTEQHIYQDRKESLRIVFIKFVDDLLNIELKR